VPVQVELSFIIGCLSSRYNGQPRPRVSGNLVPKHDFSGYRWSTTEFIVERDHAGAIAEFNAVVCHQLLLQVVVRMRGKTTYVVTYVRFCSNKYPGEGCFAIT